MMKTIRKVLALLLCFLSLNVGADNLPEGREKGDVDGDGKVSLQDVAAMARVMQESGEAGVWMPDLLLRRFYADVNCDGIVLMDDMNALVDILLGKHEAVDLGLSVCWATMNIGAMSVTGFGDYFAWGETAPKASYTEENYAYCENGTFLSIGNSIGGTKYDVAKASWGKEWRMPTLIDVNELKNKCEWTLITLGGVKVYKVKGPNGNHIYLPLAGYRRDSDLVSCGEELYAWCCMKPSTASAAYCLYGQNYTGNWSANRSYGFTVRPVRSK